MCIDFLTSLKRYVMKGGFIYAHAYETYGVGVKLHSFNHSI